MGRFSLLIVFSFLLISTTRCFAQEPLVKKYGIDYGLPSLQTYQVRIDSKGVLWVATDRGVCRLEDRKFVNYDQKSGLEDICVFALKEDVEGRMWAASFSNKVFFFEGGKFHPYWGNDTLQKTFSNRVIEELYAYQDTLWLSFAGLGVFRIEGSKAEKNISTIKKVSTSNYGSIIFSHEGKRTQINYVSANKSTPLPFSFNASHFEDSILFTPTKLDFQRTGKFGILHLNNGDFITSFPNNLIVFKQDTFHHLPYQFASSNNAVLEDPNNIVWVGSQNNGVYLFDSKSNYKQVGHYFKDHSISFIEKDPEGGIWLSTLEEGIFHLPNPQVITILPDRINKFDEFKSMAICRDTLFVMTKSKDISAFYYNKKGEPQYKKMFSYSGTVYMGHIACFRNQLLITANDTLFINSFSKHIKTLSSPAYFFSCSADKVYLHHHELQALDSSFSPTFSCKAPISFRRSSTDMFGRLWLGSIQGLYLFEGDSTIKPLHHVNKVFKSRVTDIHIRKSVFVATHGFGVAQIDPETMAVTQINTQNGLPSDSPSAVFHQKNGTLWIATSKGVCLLTEKNGTYTVDKILTTKDGILQSEVIDIVEFKGSVWLLTKGGLNQIPNHFTNENTFHPTTHIASISLLDQDSTLVLSSNALTYDQNNLRFDFHAIAYKEPFNINYSYRLIGLDSTFRTTADNHVQYASLQPGKYTFEVKAHRPDHSISKHTASWAFIVRPPLWLENWFILIVCLVIILSIFIAIRIRDRLKTRQLSLELSLLESEQKAVTAQINPHFIYNAMNSVQYHVLESKPAKAADQLAKFSELMRRVLSNTKNSFISLASEIKIIELYLSLEKERFEEKFNYSFEIEEQLDTEHIFIPSMVIQPHIENAIWHGLLKKNVGVKQLKVILSCHNDTLIWRIIDNGVGRTASKKEKSQHQHTSSGVELTSKRLRLLNERFKKPYSIEIIDLKDEKDAPLGTEIKIVMYQKKEPN